MGLDRRLPHRRNIPSRECLRHKSYCFDLVIHSCPHFIASYLPHTYTRSKLFLRTCVTTIAFPLRRAARLSKRIKACPFSIGIYNAVDSLSSSWGNCSLGRVPATPDITVPLAPIVLLFLFCHAIWQWVLLDRHQTQEHDDRTSHLSQEDGPNRQRIRIHGRLSDVRREGRYDGRGMPNAPNNFSRSFPRYPLTKILGEYGLK